MLFAESFSKQFGHRMGDSAADLIDAAGKKFLEFVNALVETRRQRPKTQIHLLVQFDNERRPLILPAATADVSNTAQQLAIALDGLERAVVALNAAFVGEATAIDWVRVRVLDNGRIRLRWMGRDLHERELEIQSPP